MNGWMDDECYADRLGDGQMDGQMIWMDMWVVDGWMDEWTDPLASYIQELQRLLIGKVLAERT